MNKIARCLDLQDRAAKIIPGMCELLSKRPDMFGRGIWPGYYKKAKGCRITDLDDNTYRDFSIGGIGATVLGYADDDVNRAVIETIGNGSASSLNSPLEFRLAEKLLALHPWAEMVRFARTGGEALAVAVRLVRAATGRDKVLFCGYHGWSDWYLAANLGTENALGEHLIPGLSPLGVPRSLAGTAIPFHFNDIEDFRRAVKLAGNDFAAVVMEPMRNYVPHPEFMDAVHETVHRLHVPLVIDEVSAGFRITNGGAHLKLGWQPDVATFAKAMGNGFPIAAIIGKASIMEAAQKTFISSTNWTESVGFAAGLATVDKFVSHDVSSHLVAVGEAVESGWKRLGEKYHLGIQISGIRPMLHFTFAENHNVNRTYYTQEMAKRGFLAGMLCYAMYAHTMDDVRDYLAATDEVWSEIAKGNVESRLEGEVAKTGFARIN